MDKRVSSRRSRVWWLVLAVVLVLIGIGVVLLQRRPAVLSISPQEEDSPVHSQTPLKIVFSHPMNPASVQENLQFSTEVNGNTAWDGNTFTFTPESSWPRGETMTFTLRSDARSATGFPLKSEATWEFRVARTMLTYLWPTEGPADIYALDLLSGDTIRLTETTTGILDYSFNTNGTHIYFSTPAPGEGSLIKQLDRLTGEITQLTACETGVCQRPQPSPNEEYLVFENTTDTTIWLLSLETSALRQIPGTQHPVWSPDGLLAVYNRNSEAYLLTDLETEESWQFTNQTGEPGSWSPDGKGFLAAEIIAGFSSHLYQYEPLSDRVVNLTPAVNDENNTPVYSPDGKWIVYAHRYLDAERWTRGRQLWLLDSTGRNVLPLTDDPLYNHSNFAWSPDGNQIAFLRFNEATLSEPTELWVIDASGENPLRLVIGAYNPQWLP